MTTADEALQVLKDLENCTSAGKLYPAAFETIRHALLTLQAITSALPEGVDPVRLVTDAVETIDGLSANIEVLLNVINDPTGGSPLAKNMILMIARNTVDDAKNMVRAQLYREASEVEG